MIQVLDSFISDKIAAGEVIERPLSIVKELVENSIDAGADSIVVEIRNGGKSYIRVTDNGCGIPAEEAEIAFERHATGKIQALEDLGHIDTLGFRGEALASICAISRMTLYTRTAESPVGIKLEIQGGRICGKEPSGMNGGTTMVVEDVFYNTPARRKFMRSDAAEASAIIDFVQKMALYYANVAFQLINNGRNVLTTNGDGNYLHAISRVYPTKEFSNLMEIQGEHVHGFISDPGTTKNNRSGQIFFVNGRYVRSDVIEKGLMDGYGDRVFSGYPVSLLFITVPPETIDVNIHPNKKEIKFLESGDIKKDIAAAVQKVIHSQDAVPQAMLKEKNISSGSTEEAAKEPVKKPSGEQMGIREFLQAKKREHKPNTETVYHEDDMKMAFQVPGDSMSDAFKSLAQEAKTEYGGEKPEVSAAPVKSDTKSEEADETDRIPLAPATTRLFDFKNLTLAGYVFNTYIITQAGDNLFILDQHAAHERILYEKLVRQYNTRAHLPQDILTPILLNVSGDVYFGEREWMDVLRRIGYAIEDFGSNTFIIRGIPAYMTLTEADAFARNLVDVQENEVHLHQNTPVVDKLIMRSCKAAVKGNDHLSEREIRELLDRLSQCVNPFSCPHGRPTFIRISKYEIERSFRRK